MISFKLRKLEDSRYMVATSYKSARNLPTNIMEHTNNPWLCISHPAPAAWASSSAYQGLAYQNDVNKFKTDSIAVTFQPIHRICLEKAHQNFTTSQDNSDSSIDLGKKDGENIQTWSNLYNIYSGGYWLWNESAGHGIKSNPATVPTVIWFTKQAAS